MVVYVPFERSLFAKSLLHYSYHIYILTEQPAQINISYFRIIDNELLIALISLIN